MSRKSITIEVLAGMVKRGFDETAKKADVDTRFDETEKTIKQEVARLEKEIADLHEDVAHLTQLPASIERRLDRVEDDMRLVKTKVGIR